MKIYRTSNVGAVLGALLASAPVALYYFGFAGPEWERTTPHRSVSGLWPLIAFGISVAVALWGGALGAIVAALRLSRLRVALLGAVFGMLSGALLVLSTFQSELGFDFGGVLARWGVLIALAATLAVLIDAVLSRLPEKPKRGEAKLVEAVFVEWLRQAVALAVTGNRRSK